jgi:hypothetical protein
MHKIAAALMLTWSSLASAAVLNVEFKFTPYTGDLKEDHVQTVPGKAQVFINNVQIAEQEVRKETVPVLFDEREVAPSIWVPVQSLGPLLRKGKNSIRIEFQPRNIKAPYHAQLSWASVMDQSTEEETSSGTIKSTNQSGEGMDAKQATGKVVFERDFVADFAADLPWHHFPPIAALSDTDKHQLAELVTARAGAFKPGFADIYRSFEGKEGIRVAEIKQAKCLDKAYAAGIRVAAPSFEKLDFAITGSPEVLVQRKGGALYDLGGSKAFERIKDDETQMCAGMALSIAYPPHLAFVRTPAGAWEVVY